jgi:hypothetical protein
MAETPEPLPKNVQCYALLAQKAGELIIEDLETAFGFKSDIFTPNAHGIFDTHAAAKRDGALSVIRRIKDRLHQTQNYGTTQKTTVIK